jgi:hypothetical protein
MANNYRDSYFLFGSACRLLAGKISAKDYKATLEDLWQWSKRKVEELNHDASDVPNFDPPATTLPPPPHNGAPEPDLPPPAEKPVKAPNPSPLPQGEEPKAPPKQEVVYISDVQVERFVAHCKKQGMSEIGINRWLRDNGISSPVKIPLTVARDLWERAKVPEVVKRYQ